MNKEKAKKAKKILESISEIERIKNATEKEKFHWWSFATPNTTRNYATGIEMPDALRAEFIKAIDNSLEKLNMNLKEL